MLKVSCFKHKENLQIVDSLVLLTECAKLVAELGCPFTLVNFNFASQSLELVDILWTAFFLNSEELHVECLLVSLLKESYQELACSEYLRLENAVEKALIVGHPLSSLVWSQLFLCSGWKGRNNCLRILS